MSQVLSQAGLEEIAEGEGILHTTNGLMRIGRTGNAAGSVVYAGSLGCVRTPLPSEEGSAGTGGLLEMEKGE